MTRHERPWPAWEPWRRQLLAPSPQGEGASNNASAASLLWRGLWPPWQVSEKPLPLRGGQGVSPCLREFLKNACGANSMGLRFFVVPELPDGEPQHERPDEPHEQQRLPPGPEFRWKGSDCPETPDGTDRFPVRASSCLIGEI